MLFKRDKRQQGPVKELCLSGCLTGMREGQKHLYKHTERYQRASGGQTPGHVQACFNGDHGQLKGEKLTLAPSPNPLVSMHTVSVDVCSCDSLSAAMLPSYFSFLWLTSQQVPSIKTMRDLGRPLLTDKGRTLPCNGSHLSLGLFLSLAARERGRPVLEGGWVPPATPSPSSKWSIAQSCC